jgi:hypothetical protein
LGRELHGEQVHQLAPTRKSPGLAAGVPCSASSLAK